MMRRGCLLAESMSDPPVALKTIGYVQGIGKAIVEELASLGASVLTCSRTSADVTACLEVRVRLSSACVYWTDPLCA